MSKEPQSKNIGNNYQWKIASPVEAEMMDRFPEWTPVAVQMLANRGFDSQEDVDSFLTPDYGQDQHDPYLFQDMQKAIDRISEAIEKNERIVVHGDYDADGVGGAAVLYKTFKKIGANIHVYLPHRDTEGYGLNMNTVKKLHEEGTALIITVDCGISNKPEVEKAVELGMDVIVTDHHSEPPELPTAALAILNPKLPSEPYPFSYLCGAGVAFKVSQALIAKYELGEAFEKWLLDIVAISTVADFVELTDENRIFVKYGLVVMRKNQRPGLRQLFAAIGVDAHKATTTTIGFNVGPHVNAAGRMKHANAAFEMLVEENEERAGQLAADLIRTNKERRSVSDKASRAAMKQAREQENEQIMIVRVDDCPVGLVGLVAGKVSSEMGKPAFVVTSANGDIMGSGRSIEQFNLVEALQANDELFEKYGGHPMACGFTLKGEEQYDEFVNNMRERAREILEGADLRKSLQVERVIALPETNWELLDILDQFAPYGEGNPEPIFVSQGVKIVAVSAVGKTKKHLKFTVEQDNVQRPCIGFGLGEWAEKLTVGSMVDIAYAASVNEWNGNREIQLEVKDLVKRV